VRNWTSDYSSLPIKEISAGAWLYKAISSIVVTLVEMVKFDYYCSFLLSKAELPINCSHKSKFFINIFSLPPLPLRPNRPSVPLHRSLFVIPNEQWTRKRAIASTRSSRKIRRIPERISAAPLAFQVAIPMAAIG
jgi:hypothetical protein